MIASDAADDDHFAGSVAVSGDMAVIGAAGNDDVGESSGSAYVFTREGSGSWAETAKLTASDAGGFDHFGCSVAISGDTVVIGATGNGEDRFSNSGSAFIFTRDRSGSWAETAKLSASDARKGDDFGCSVAISGDTAVIGAVGNDDVGESSGSAYVFTRDGSGSWTETAKLTASDAGREDYFGKSVSISGDTIVIGVDHDRTDSGAAYVFTRDEAGLWTQATKLTASDALKGDDFGYSVSVSGDMAVVGAKGDNHEDHDSGSAYVFTRDGSGTWTQATKLAASDAEQGDLFGNSVAITGDTAVIGAAAAGYQSGSAYVYDLSPYVP